MLLFITSLCSSLMLGSFNPESNSYKKPDNQPPLTSKMQSNPIDTESLHNLEQELPTFNGIPVQKSIHLFQNRLYATIAAQLLLDPNSLPQDIQNWLKTTEGKKFVQQASGYTNARQIGHDENRIEVYSGKPVQPHIIALTFSGKATLQATINALKTNRLAHNFFIDRDGKFYPVTNEGESIEEALMHRPFNVGQSALVVDGFSQLRDLNSRTISISLVGLNIEPATKAQTDALLKLLPNLMDKYNIKPDHVVDYGCIAYPYGRRKPQSMLPWQQLAQQNVALWPTKHIPDISSLCTEEAQTTWASASLNKIGFICPITQDKHHPDFIAALQTFQQHYQCDSQDGTISLNTVASLNSILQQKEIIHPILRTIYPAPLPIVIPTDHDCLTIIED